MTYPVAVAALILYVPAAACLMMDRNSARGFTAVLLVGLLVLPEQYELTLPGVPNLYKSNAPLLGALIGTIIFHPRKFDRFRLSISDIALLGLLLSTFITAFFYLTPREAVSDVASLALTLVLLIFLARIHLGTPNGLRIFLLGIVIAGAVYAPLALWEFRMSPQIHSTVYGYFQHVFQQHARGGFWRPIICFSHALALGRFFAFAAFLALLPMRRDLVRLIGKPGNYVFLLPLAGLVSSQSAGPMILFGLLCAGYAVIHLKPWTVFVIPVAGWAWLLLAMAGWNLHGEVTPQIETMSEDRADSLQYRLDALEEYRTVILNAPFFGYGMHGDGRIEGRATDSQGLISLLVRGFVGTTFYIGWYFLALFAAVRVMQLARGTPLAEKVSAIAMLGGLAIFTVVIDAAFDLHVIALFAVAVSLHGWLATRPQIPTLQTFEPQRRGSLAP